jgi:hypothetical protein
MSKAPSSQQFVKIVDGPTQPSGSGFGYLLVGVMAVFLIITDTYGFGQATDLPPLIGLIIAVLACAIKMYMLRRRPPHERATSGGLERMMGYLPPALLSVALSSFAIYSFFMVDSEASLRQQSARKGLENVTVVIEDFYRTVRTKIRTRIETNAERLRELSDEPPSPQQQGQIAGLEEEQQMLRALLRQTADALRPAESDLPSPGDPPDGDGPIDEDAAQEGLRKKFNAAASLHQQLPDSIRYDVEVPKLESLPEDAVSGGKLESFFRDTMALTNEAIGCLAVPAILELFIVIIVLSNRPRD